MEKETKKDIMFNRMKEKKNEVKVVRKIVLVIVLITLLAVVLIGYSGYEYVTKALQPVDVNSEEIIPVDVVIGSNLDSISAQLEENGIIHDARIFKYYAKFNNESDFQAGNYKLTKAMTLDELIESLKTGKVYREPVFSMNVPEGLTLNQIANVIEKRTDYTADEFLELVRNPQFIDEMIGKYPTVLSDEVKGEDIRYALEGYLYPATYSFYEDKPSLRSIVEQMLNSTKAVTEPYAEVLAENEKSVHWLLTFASLLEEEASAATDREMIASVFLNRLESGMPLQTDPTVLYAFEGDRNNIATDKDKAHAYNTYQIPGLPPGPIANPGKESIDAVLNAPETNYLFFLADSSGTNYFADTYEEHLANIEKHLR